MDDNILRLAPMIWCRGGNHSPTRNASFTPVSRSRALAGQTQRSRFRSRRRSRIERTSLSASIADWYVMSAGPHLFSADCCSVGWPESGVSSCSGPLAYGRPWSFIGLHGDVRFTRGLDDCAAELRHLGAAWSPTSWSGRGIGNDSEQSQIVTLIPSPYQVDFRRAARGALRAIYLCEALPIALENAGTNHDHVVLDRDPRAATKADAWLRADPRFCYTSRCARAWPSANECNAVVLLGRATGFRHQVGWATRAPLATADTRAQRGGLGNGLAVDAWRSNGALVELIAIALRLEPARCAAGRSAARAASHFVSRHDAKGPDFLNAIARLNRDVPNVELTMLSHGP